LEFRHIRHLRAVLAAGEDRFLIEGVGIAIKRGVGVGECERVGIEETPVVSYASVISDYKFKT
jgi:hypothetical protein